jgi:hypothetical protein
MKKPITISQAIHHALPFKRDESKTIFTVTGIEGFSKEDVHRSFGWYADKNDAIRDVLKNSCDIYEYSHTYALIEEIKEGIYGFSIKEWWFKWDEKDERYVPIAKPKESVGIINWSL